LGYDTLKLSVIDAEPRTRAWYPRRPLPRPHRPVRRPRGTWGGVARESALRVLRHPDRLPAGIGGARGTAGV